MQRHFRSIEEHVGRRGAAALIEARPKPAAMSAAAWRNGS
jgi:hypothetical protein